MKRQADLERISHHLRFKQWAWSTGKHIIEALARDILYCQKAITLGLKHRIIAGQVGMIEPLENPDLIGKRADTIRVKGLLERYHQSVLLQILGLVYYAEAPVTYDATDTIMGDEGSRIS